MDSKKFVLERIQTWVAQLKFDGTMKDDEDMLSSIYGDIDEDRMLCKEQAKYLQSKLEAGLELEIGRLASKYPSLLRGMSDLIPYHEAYQRYCRPGTYMIVIGDTLL